MANPVFPTVRKYYAGIDNPLFLGDITTADNSVIDALKSVTGLVNGDFAIVSGLDYVLGTPNTYTPGIIYWNGDFFYSGSTLTEGLYLQTSYVDVLLETFNDATARNIYINQVATSTSTSTGNTPQFTGDMDAYRINNKFMRLQIANILSVTDTLGTAAFANLGTGTGEILTAEQTYTQAQVNALLLTRSPSCVGCVVTVYDFDGTFPTNFNGSGLGIVYPWYNSLTGERWGIMDDGGATSGGNTAPNIAGKTEIGQGTDAGANTFTEGTTYGSNTLTLVANNIPVLQTQAKFAAGSGSVPAYGQTASASSLSSEPVNFGSPNTPINTMQSSLALYKVIRLS